MGNSSSSDRIEIRRLSADETEMCDKTGSTVEDMKKHLAEKFGTTINYVDIVCLDNGIIYDDVRDMVDIQKPLQVMIGNPSRESFPDELQRTMSCGHSLKPLELFIHMKHTLLYKGNPNVRCQIKSCNAIWDMSEIFRKADMTEDEKIFFENSSSLNLIYQTGNEISECPSCGNFCQRQNQDVIPTRCLSCSKDKGTPYDFCWICKSPWINNHNCGGTDTQEDQKILNDAYENKLKQFDYANIKNVPSIRFCPKCNYFIEHWIKCKTMKCRNCSMVFCFVCLQGINDKGILRCGEYNEKCEVAPVQKVTSN